LAILAAKALHLYALIIQHLIKVNSVCGDIKRITSSTTYRIPTLKGIKNAGLIKVILKETLFVTASMKKASIKYEAFSAHNTYLEKKNQCC
jgi:hypothetical protein